MFKIGEVSKLTQISIRMLRYYDELGILFPFLSEIQSSLLRPYSCLASFKKSKTAFHYQTNNFLCQKMWNL